MPLITVGTDTDTPPRVAQQPPHRALAISVSTPLMISQNRADAEREVIANEQWTTVQEEDKQNQELLDPSRQILELTKEVRALAGRDDVRRP
jgi:hypothetical protein